MSLTFLMVVNMYIMLRKSLLALFLMVATAVCSLVAMENGIDSKEEVVDNIICVGELSTKDFINDLGWLCQECSDKASRHELRFGETENTFAALLLDRDLAGSCAKFVVLLYQASLCTDFKVYAELIQPYFFKIEKWLEMCGEIGKLRFITVVVAELCFKSEKTAIFDKKIKQLFVFNRMYHSQRNALEWRMNVAMCCKELFLLCKNECLAINNLFAKNIISMPDSNL